MTPTDLTNAFSIPSTFTALARPQDFAVPLVSKSTLWISNVDAFWLFSDVIFGQFDYDNTLWRFNSSSESPIWALIDGRSANLIYPQPADGAGCSDPLRSTRYCLVGMVKSTNSSEIGCVDSMTLFDMKTERTTARRLTPKVLVSVMYSKTNRLGDYR